MAGTSGSSFARILVTVDGSKNALAACGVTASIGKAAGAKVTVLCVSTLPAGSRGEDERIVDEAASVIGEQGLVAEREVVGLEGSVARTITDYADRGAFDLTVMGKRGLGEFTRLIIGSVSSAVATLAQGPVMVVASDPSGEASLPGRIVVAADGSASSNRAVELAAKLAVLLKARLDILHVVHVSGFAYGMPRAAPIGQMEEALREIGEQVVAEAAALAERQGISPAREVRDGVSPAQGIVDYAARTKAELVVVGTRGLGGVSKLLMGSVANSVLHYAGCSVLVVK